MNSTMSNWYQVKETKTLIDNAGFKWKGFQDASKRVRTLPVICYKAIQDDGMDIGMSFESDIIIEVQTMYLAM